MFGKVLFFIFTLAAGLYSLARTEYIVREIGHNAWAEKHLGQGGSYTLWKIIGVGLIVLGFLVVIGELDWLLTASIEF